MSDPRPSTDLVPTSAPELATLIYDRYTPDLFGSLVARLGDREAAVRLWWEAADLLERHFPVPRSARAEAPRPYEVVFTRDGTDHAVVPGYAVTVCGLELPLLFSVNPPCGVPCGDCFGVTS